LLLVVLLVLVWAGAGVWWLWTTYGRELAQGADSIRTFRRQLRVLQRTGPDSYRPSHTLRDNLLPPGHNPEYYGPAAVPSYHVPVARRAALAYYATAPVVRPIGLGRAFANTPSAVAFRRRRVQKRRRDLLYGLLAGVGGSLLLGFIPGLSAMWFLSAALVLVLVVYVAALIQIRNASTERVAKVRVLRPREPRAAEPAFLLRRSAN